MPPCKQNKLPEKCYIFKAGIWLQLIKGYVKEPGKQYATRLEFSYRTNDNFTPIPFNKVVKAIKLRHNGFTSNEDNLVKARLTREIPEIKRKLEMLEHRSQPKKKEVSSCSELSDSDSTTNTYCPKSTRDCKIQTKTFKNVCKGNKDTSDRNKDTTLEKGKENKLQKPSGNRNFESIEEIVIPKETVKILMRFASNHPEFLECINKNFVDQENRFQSDEGLLNFLYTVNPLVNVENMNLFRTLVKNNISNVTLNTNKEEKDLISIEDFAAGLGLINVKSNILKYICKTRRERTWEESDNTQFDRNTYSVSPMDKLPKKQKGPFRSEKVKVIDDFLSKKANNSNEGPRSNKLRKKRPVNYRVTSSNSESSAESDIAMKKARLCDETPITKFMTHLRKAIVSDSNNHNVKKNNEIVFGKRFPPKAPFDENCDYLKNLQKDLRNVRKKEAASEVAHSSSSISSSPVKRPDLARVCSSDPSTLSSVQRGANVGSKQLDKILCENNRNTKVDSDVDAIKVYSEKNNKTNGENILRATKKNQRFSQSVSYVDNRVSKPYSMAEDTMILDFIVKNGYENKVKGNMIWKEFEEYYGEISQEKRSWQSLKNRYLRNIIKNLKDYSLPPDKERKLRIASCLGSGPIKVKSNSLSPVLSAWNAQRRKQLKNSDESLKKATKAIKANNTDAPVAGSSSNTPHSKRLRSTLLTYTQRIKKFSKDHTYSYSDGSTDENVSISPKPSRKKLYRAVVH